MKYLAFTIHYSTAHFVVSEQLYLALDFNIDKALFFYEQVLCHIA